MWCKEHWAAVTADERVNGIAATVNLGNAFVEILRKENAEPQTPAGYNAELRKRGPVCCQLTPTAFKALLAQSVV